MTRGIVLKGEVSCFSGYYPSPCVLCVMDQSVEPLRYVGGAVTLSPRWLVQIVQSTDFLTHRQLCWFLLPGCRLITDSWDLGEILSADPFSQRLSTFFLLNIKPHLLFLLRLWLCVCSGWVWLCIANKETTPPRSSARFTTSRPIRAHCAHREGGGWSYWSYNEPLKAESEYT